MNSLEVGTSSNVNKLECKPTAVRPKTKLKKEFLDVNTHDVLCHRFIPSEYFNHYNLYIESEQQIYTKHSVSRHGTTYRCRVKGCNSRVSVYGNRCYKKIRTAPHNHPDVDDRIVKDLEALEDLRRKVESMAFELASPKKWKEILAKFTAQYPNFDCEQYSVSLEKIRKRTIELSKISVIRRLRGNYNNRRIPKLISQPHSKKCHSLKAIWPQSGLKSQN